MKSPRWLVFTRSILFACACECFHTLNYYVAIACRIMDIIAPNFLSRIFRAMCFRQRVEVTTASGVCIGERAASVPLLSSRSQVFKFEGVPYATLHGDRYGAPMELEAAATKETVLNKPRFLDLGFRFGSAATLAPQVPAIFTLDAPVVTTGLQVWLAKKVFGYLGASAVDDCLQLNVWCPKEALEQRMNKPLLPVLVFFHGGAFIFGSCHQTIANGQSLADSGKCIVVSCNYRLGILGYLRIPGAACQNRGLRDQVAALRWVKKNIRMFGGDPDRVTISGQSAGSMSVGALLGVPECYSERLFSKATMFSGTPQFLPTKATAQHLFGHCARIFGMEEDGFDALLRKASLAEIIRIQAKLDRECNRAYKKHLTAVVIPFQPYVEDEERGAVLPHHPVHYLQTRTKEKKPIVPLLIGSTGEEYTFFTRLQVQMFPIADGTMKGRIRQWMHSAFEIPIIAPPGGSDEKKSADAESRFAAFAKHVEQAYSEGGIAKRYGPPYAAFNAMNGDYLFRIPSEFLATVCAASDERLVWVYRFDRAAVVPGLGATHALDLHYFFNTWWCPPYYTGGWSSNVQRLTDVMMSELLTWVAEPRVTSATLSWPQWDASTRPQRQYGGPSGDVAVMYNSDERETAAWGNALERQLKARNERLC